ncbi:MAG: MBL fold metallo-hydrolase [Sphingomonadales bacterium]
MQWKQMAAMIGLVGAIGLSPAIAQDMDDVKIRTIDVADGIYMLMGRGGNIGVSAGEDGVYLIDDQFAPLTNKIRAAVADISDKPVRFVLNTHWHWDHTGGNENFGNAGSVIIAHDNVYKRMSVDQFVKAFDRQIPAAPAAALPVITFDDTVTLHLNGVTTRAVHVPHAHTDGDSIIHFKEANVLHMGDTYFSGMYPFIDVQSGGSIDGMIAAVEVGLSLADDNTRIIPGHGPLSNKRELAEYRDMLKAARDRIASAVENGVAIDKLTASRPLADLDEKWGGGFFKADRFVAIVYQDFANGRK